MALAPKIRVASPGVSAIMQELTTRGLCPPASLASRLSPMNFPSFRTGPLHSIFSRRSWAATALLAAGLLATVRAADAPAASEFKVIDRTNFACKYPTAWKEATDDPDYKAESHFTLNGPDKKQSYISFDIVDKVSDPTKLLASTIESLDGYAITALDKTKIEEWGQFKGAGMHLKGKILGAYPGGIKVFIFNSDHHNIMVIEYYWAEELKDLTADIDYIQNNFTMKN
jgi:hypothetical protein